MSFAEIIIALLMAIIIGSIFYYVFKVTGPWGSFWTFILILILAGIAAGAWVEPVGPTVYGTPWLSTLIVIFLFALLIAAATPPRRKPETPAEREAMAEASAEASGGAIALGVFFWVLLIFLFIAAIWGIAWTPVV